MHSRTSLIVVMLTGVTPAAVAQAVPGAGYLELGEAEEIALARSGGPETVSAEATIWVARDGKYVIAHEGSSGNHCWVGRTYPESLEPVCYDVEASQTILRIEMREFELRTAGKSPEEVNRAIAEAIGSGELRVPARAAMSYMMSSGQVLFSREGRAAGNWKPHLMIYLPYITHADIGLAGPSLDLQVVNEGTPKAYIVVVVPEFVDPVR